MLLGTEEVRTELGIRDDQQKQIDELINEVQNEMRASFDMRAMFELSEEQRQAQFEDTRKKMEATVAKAEQRVAKILEAPQLERLNQLAIAARRFRGVWASRCHQTAGADRSAACQVR